MYSLWLLFILMTARHALLGRSERICPMMQCDSCLDISLKSTPGIGLHLGLTSGTATVGYNDHNEDIIHIPASPEYLAMMQEFTTQLDRLDRSPLDTPAQRWNFVYKELKRRANLIIGRPGTPNAGTLSDMLTLLLSNVETQLSPHNMNVGIAVPNGALVSREELNDALSHAGLKKLDEWQWRLPDRELNAAYGAHGFGMCSSYTDPYKCEQEEAAFGDGNLVLHIDYTNKTLAANIDWLSTARSTSVMRNLVDWDLGRDEAPDGEEGIDYWNAVRSRIRAFATASQHPYDELLLTGERAQDEKFLEAVKDALWGLELVKRVELKGEERDSTFIVARGAAEFQRRRQQGWVECVQPKHCSEKSIWRKATTRVREVLEL